MKKNINAFTLAELIVVIVIIAILWTIALVSFVWYADKAKDTQRISDLKIIWNWLEINYANKVKYPKPDFKKWETKYWTWEFYWLIFNTWVFLTWAFENARNISNLPEDPTTWDYYLYWLTIGSGNYVLQATLRTEKDSSWKLKTFEVSSIKK